MPAIITIMPDTFVSKEDECCNSVMIFNMVASYIYCNIMPFMNNGCMPKKKNLQNTAPSGEDQYNHNRSWWSVEQPQNNMNPSHWTVVQQSLEERNIICKAYYLLIKLV